MADEWHYTVDGNQQGPVSASELKRLAASGNLGPTDLIWKEGMAEWKPASSVRGLFSSPRTPAKQGPPIQPNLGVESATRTESTGGDSVNSPPQHPPLSPEPPQSSGWLKRLAGNVTSTGQLVAKQAEKTKLTTVSLPAAYRKLGQHIYGDGQLRGDLTHDFEAIDGLTAELAQLSAVPDTSRSPQGVTQKAKGIADSAKRAAQRKVVEQKLSQAFAALGKTAFQQHGPACGPDTLASQVQEYQARLATLDAELAESPSVFTPKRIILGGAVGTLLLLLAFYVLWGGSDSSGMTRQEFIHTLASLHGTDTWNWTWDRTRPTSEYPAGLPRTSYVFTKAKRAKIPFTQMIQTFGEPEERSGTWDKETWVYSCADGSVTLIFVNYNALESYSPNKDDALQLTYTAIIGHHEF